MKRLKNKGFSAVEILIVVVIVGLIGTAGWLVYSRHSTENKDENRAATSQTNANPAPSSSEVVIPEGYKSYQNDEYNFSFAYPKDWKFVEIKPTATDTSEKLSIQLSRRVTREDAVANTANRELYKNDLRFVLSVSKDTFGEGPVVELDENSKIVLNVESNAKKASLVSSTYEGQVVDLMLKNCTATGTACSSYSGVKLKSGEVLAISISSISNVQAATIPIDLNGNDFKEVKNILKTLRFE